MAKPQSTRNPIAFTPLPVTAFITLVFAALFTSLVTIHNVVPPAPKSPTPIAGINITEAWSDLQHLSNGFHPYNSHRNNEVRTWLLTRIDEILERNDVDFTTGLQAIGKPKVKPSNSAVHIYNDLESSLLFGSPDSSLAVAFTGENIIVYIRGSEDEDGMWWEEKSTYEGKGGVLVNAHFDSVPTGYGTTDDGVGVISILQLISYFTTPQHKPKRGVVALLNNGEEDFLNGAYVFSQHPISKFPHTFLNLEGAGAGGRATLFRTTDNEVTKFYRKSPHPFGTVVSADGFKQGLVRSQTDYIIFNGELGMRGLDVAFMEPRSRYHTVEDSTKYTSKDSLWHMLSAAIATMQGLTSDTSSTFEGKASVEGGVSAGQGSDTVWFDLFGRSFAVFELHTVFAVSVTLLVVTPLILIALNILLARSGKWYLFSRKGYLHSSDDDDWVVMGGWRGFFRIPIAIVASTAAVIGLAYLVMKVNPYIVYSSEYSLWTMNLTAWFVISWFLLRGADAIRPSALHRPFALLWLYIGSYVVLVGVTISETKYKISGGYFMVVYSLAIFCALLVSHLEFFALPKKSDYVHHVMNESIHSSTPGHAASLVSSRPATASNGGNRERSSSRHLEDDDAEETTSLLRGQRSTFSGGYGSRSVLEPETEEEVLAPITLHEPYGEEQGWSGQLPRWTWLLQFLLLSVVPIILVGQVALLMTSALGQTSSDGSPVSTPYLLFAVLSLLLLAPMTPFLHRFHFPIPTLLFLICIGTMIYNLVAFPFSSNSRLKVYFVQEVDLDSGINEVGLTGLMPYVKDVISAIPSAAGQKPNCSSPGYSARAGLTKCRWHGIPPDVRNGHGLPPTISPDRGYKSWLDYNVSLTAPNATSATFYINGKNTRACRLQFDRNITDFNVTGFGTDPRFPRVQKKGCTSIRLWSREWDSQWKVHVKWEGSGGLDGKVVCLWSDANDPITIPAFTEVMRYMPVWSMATKLSDGLVEGSKVFKV